MKANFDIKLDLKALLRHVKRGFQKSNHFNFRKVKISASIFGLAKKYKLCILKLLQSIELELSHPCAKSYIQRAGHSQEFFSDDVSYVASELNIHPIVLLNAVEYEQSKSRPSFAYIK